MFKEEASYVALKNSARKFAEKYVAQQVKESDAKRGFSFDWFKAAGEEGLLKAGFAKEYGGQGLGYPGSAIIVEEVAKYSGAMAAALFAHLQCAHTISESGTELQIEKYLKPAIEGKLILSFSITEEQSGSDILSLHTVADKTDDGWVINGSKRWITNIGLGGACIFSAKTTSRRSRRDVSMFIVDEGVEGLSVSKIEDTMGVRNLSVGQIKFSDCLISSDSLLGEENFGYDISHKALDISRIFISAAAIGLAKGALHNAMEYMRNREQYGRTLTYYQGVSFPLSEMYTEIAAAQAFLDSICQQVINGKCSSGEIAALKLFATERCCEICDKAQQMLGGNGFLEEYQLARYVRDCKMLRLSGGTSDICRIIIGNSILYR